MEGKEKTGASNVEFPEQPTPKTDIRNVAAPARVQTLPGPDRLIRSTKTINERYIFTTTCILYMMDLVIYMVASTREHYESQV